MFNGAGRLPWGDAGLLFAVAAPRQQRGGWRLRTAVAAMLVLLVTLSFGSVAEAAQESPAIRILPVAILGDGGATMTVSMIVRCGPSDHMLEGFASAEQEDLGMLTGFDLVCDGRTHVVHATVYASGAGDLTFQRGVAEVSAIIFDEHTGTSVDEDSRTVLVRGPTADA